VVKLSRAQLAALVFLIVTAAGAAVAYGYTQYVSQDHYTPGLGRIDSYSAGEQPTQLTIHFSVGAQDVVEGPIVVEDAGSITVKVNIAVFQPGTGRFKNLAAYGREMTLTLKDPLGERSVTDGGTGAKVPATRVGTTAAVTACASTAYGGRVVGAFTLRAADLALQDETRGGPGGPHPLRSQFRDYSADTPIVLCFFDGFIAASQPPPIPPATPLPPYDRYVLTVDPSGQARLAVAGYRDRIAVAPQLP
jgi:hypothetical protein